MLKQYCDISCLPVVPVKGITGIFIFQPTIQTVGFQSTISGKTDILHS
jgi:hypothetical protein